MATSSSNEPRTILSWAGIIAQALEVQGVDSRVLFKKARIPYQSTVDPGSRIETSKIATLFQLAIAETQNPAFGLTVINYFNPANFHALGYSLLASSTLYEFCQRIVRFFRIVSESAEHHLYKGPDNYRLTIKTTSPSVCFESVDGWVGCIVILCRSIYRSDYSPLRIELIRPEPATHAEDFERFYNAQVSFSAAENAVYFNKKDMLQALPASNSELARRNDEVVIEHLARLDREDIVRQVESQIIELLPTGECSRNRVALRLNMSPNNLLRKLEQRNTTYQKILEDLRSELARHYIEQKNLRIGVLGTSPPNVTLIATAHAL